MNTLSNYFTRILPLPWKNYIKAALAYLENYSSGLRAF
jgi:hypothetical protein